MNETRGIYKRGDIYWISFQRNNKRQFISLETRDISEAIERAQEVRDNPNLNPGHSVKSEMIQFLNYKRTENEYTESSYESKKYILGTFHEWLGRDVTADRITTSDIQSYYAHVRKGRSISTANGYIMTLRAFFRWAVRVSKIARRNPCEGVKLARFTQSARLDFCTPELRDKLVNECPREDLKFVLYCGFHAGLRFNEIVEARPFWFDLNAGLLHLRKTETMQFKSREERTIPLTQGFQKFLKEYGLREPYMLRPDKEKRGKSLYRYDFGRPFDIYMEEHGCTWVTPHIMRHTFASLLASAGVSIFKIAKWVGDDVKVVQRHYAKLLPNDADIERAHSGSPPAAKRSQARSKSLTS